MASTLREELAQEFQRIPDERLGEVVSFLHRLGLKDEPEERPSPKRRQPSPRLACQGARLLGDDLAPVIPPEDWRVLSSNGDGVAS